MFKKNLFLSMFLLSNITYLYAGETGIVNIKFGRILKQYTCPQKGKLKDIIAIVKAIDNLSEDDALTLIAGGSCDPEKPYTTSNIGIVKGMILKSN